MGHYTETYEAVAAGAGGWRMRHRPSGDVLPAVYASKEALEADLAELDAMPTLEEELGPYGGEWQREQEDRAHGYA